MSSHYQRLDRLCKRRVARKSLQQPPDLIWLAQSDLLIEVELAARAPSRADEGRGAPVPVVYPTVILALEEVAYINNALANVDDETTVVHVREVLVE